MRLYDWLVTGLGLGVLAGTLAVLAGYAGGFFMQ